VRWENYAQGARSGGKILLKKCVKNDRAGPVTGKPLPGCDGHNDADRFGLKLKKPGPPQQPRQ
jgi:hypothetical protein